MINLQYLLSKIRDQIRSLIWTLHVQHSIELLLSKYIDSNPLWYIYLANFTCPAVLSPDTQFYKYHIQACAKDFYTVINTNKKKSLELDQHNKKITCCF